MRKLKLELDDIQVESFETNRLEAERGTVRGHVSIANPCTGQCDTVNDATCDPEAGCTNTAAGDYTCIATNCADQCSTGVWCSCDYCG